MYKLAQFLRQEGFMRSIRTVAIVYLCFALVLSTPAQQSPAPPVQAPALLQSALVALAGTTSVTDVTLSGTAHYIAGSDDETGTAVLKAIMGATRVDLTLPSGLRTEIMNISGGQLAGRWIGTDGVSHAIADHNLLLIDPGWFFPVFPLSRGLATGYIATYVGSETKDSLAVQHLSISWQPAHTSSTAALLQHLSQVDLYLDSSSFLPVSLAFNVHPDDNALLDIPIEVRFSDYRSVNGVQIPFHVQKFLNNGLILDLQFQSAILSSGLSASAF
jgi:hypothetical protein